MTKTSAVIVQARPLVLVMTTAVVLTACSSSSSSTTSAAKSQLSRIRAATAQSTASSPSPSPSPTGPTIDLATLDACALITAADANSVAHAEMLDNFQTASTVYRFTATKQPGTNPSCKFSVADDDEQGTVAFAFQPATSFVVGPSDTPISGLGDEAYDDGDDPVVRVGNVKISASDDSFSDSFTIALLRKIITHLRAT